MAPTSQRELDGLPALAAAVAAAGVPVGTLAAAALVNNRVQADRAAFLRQEGPTIEAMVGRGGIAAVEAIDMSPWVPVPEAVVHRIIRAFHDAGVRLIVGTDSHHPSLLAGRAGLDEIELLARSGLSPFAALEAATSGAAAGIGQADAIGRVAVGHRADLLLMAENPLDDPAALRALSGVMAAGRWLDRDALDVLLQAAVMEGEWPEG